jgi:hypothetical protein
MTPAIGAIAVTAALSTLTAGPAHAQHLAPPDANAVATVVGG